MPEKRKEQRLAYQAKSFLTWTVDNGNALSSVSLMFAVISIIVAVVYALVWLFAIYPYITATTLALIAGVVIIGSWQNAYRDWRKDYEAELAKQN